MGLLSGKGGSFVRFGVEGEFPADLLDFAAGRIGEFSFRDIDDNLDERSVGWVSVYDMLDREFAGGAWLVGDWVVLSLRIDERKIQAAVLKKLALKEEARIKKERQIPKLSRNHRQEIKEMVRLGLLKKAVPAPAVYDLAWDLTENSILFYSTSGTAIGVLEEFFKECFGVHLIQQIPYIVGARIVEPELAVRIGDMKPTIFV